MKTLKVGLFRHGPSAYKQGNVLCFPNKAYDLMAKALHDGESEKQRETRAIEEVQQSAFKLADSLDRTIPVRILSSPVGRTLHTAVIIRDVLMQRGFTVFEIESNRKFGEVANFSWSLFEPLMNGGKIEYFEGFEKHHFEVEKGKTNPDNLGYPEYFICDAVHKIPADVKASWPEVYTTQVEGFETFTAVTARFMKEIDQLAHVETGQFIIVTHDCAAMYLADSFTGGQQKGLVPGTFILMERKHDDGRLVVTRVGDCTEGNDKKDFVRAFLASAKKAKK